MKIYNYGRQDIQKSDIDEVISVLKSDFLTCGPKVEAYEQAIADYTGAKYCVCVSSATAGLHLCTLALELKSGDEVITSPITFLASANAARYTGASVVFADIEEDTANIDINEVSKHINSKTKAIIPVHFAGQSVDMKALSKVAKDIPIIEDAAHAIGSEYNGKKVGSCEYSKACVFSFHPVKTITTAEGGAITTNDESFYKKLLTLRSHGMKRTKNWEYEMHELGFNYRMPDLNAALGLSQLKRLDSFKARRREIVARYNDELGLEHLIERDFSNACPHLYVVLVDNRDEFYQKAKDLGLNLQVHYIPVNTQPYYKALGEQKCEKAESYYKKCISLPLYPSLSDDDISDIISRIKKIL